MMCFSAEASFAAATFLAVIGVFSCRQIKSNKQLLFALIPLGFSLQQFSEGMIWLSASHSDFPSQLIPFFSWVYILFAYMIWPILIPLSILLMETKQIKKKIMLVFVIFAIFLSFNNILYFDYNVTITCSSIRYANNLASLYGISLYGLIASIPMLISSMRFCWLMGIIGWISLVITEYFYSQYFLSVWCFFCAIISGMIVLILYKSNQTKSKAR